jgi:hypothetical protein
MGYSYACNIERAGTHLLSLLKIEGTVQYSRFYDGSEETALALAKAMGFDEEEAEWNCPEHLMDLAAGELERAGIVVTGKLPDKLTDGYTNYFIQLTTEGRKWLEGGERFAYWDAE